MKSKLIPDLSTRPHTMTIERLMQASAAELYEAWTQRFDKWFAEPGNLLMVPEIDKPYFFYNRFDWGRHAHYGRFIELVKNERIQMAWLTGEGGTEGDETVITVELIPQNNGTLLRLTHSGFRAAAAAQGHKDNWPEALKELDECLAKAGAAK